MEPETVACVAVLSVVELMTRMEGGGGRRGRRRKGREEEEGGR